ncbi:MAG: HlyD family efflux transporter periplasmic adaptor subunit [Acidobacteriota bacterium]|jgi:HlyD family secretion protein
MMDIKRDTSGKKKRQILYGVIGVVAVLAVTYFLSTLERAAPTVDSATLWIDEVKRGELLLERRGAGTLVPEEIRAVAARSSGRVEEIVLLPGAPTEPDTVLLRLSNPDLELAARNAEWDYAVEQSNFRDLQVQLETERLQRRSEAAAVSADYKTAQIQYQRDLELFEEGLTSERDMLISKNRAEELEQRNTIEQERLGILEDSIDARLDQARANLSQRKARYELAARDVAALDVTAGIKGVLQEMPMEVGQSVTPGMVLARVVNPDKLKAQLRIPETQAKDIVVGQPAVVDIRTATIPGEVTRIDPSASQGTVTVDVKLLVDKLPPGARPQLSIDGTVEVRRLPDVLYVGKPAYGQSDSQVGLFKLVDDGDYAVRVTVQLGLGSVNLIEVVQGLNEGDRVVLSDMSRWDSVDRVRLR